MTFTRALVEMLLRVAPERELVVLDRPQVDSIVRAMRSPDAGRHEG
jgi:hypothetical protein